MAELHLEREFDAPRHLVWKAFTDPDELAAWFGPDGYRVPRETVDVDVRPGGHWHLDLVADDPSYPPGGPMRWTVQEVVDGELIVWSEAFGPEQAAFFGSDRMDTRVEFHDAGDDRTRLVVTQGPFRDDFVGHARAGWAGSFDGLERLLAG
jgi:uncharacterized protein YndB with AHSA1/START domain